MNPDALSAALLAVIAPLAEARRPGAAADLTVADLPLERPRNRDHGDWASNAALKLGKAVGANPREFAQEIATALEATPGVASVEVADGEAVVRIADNGPGINPEIADELFERFARADTSRARQTGGTGLGLSLLGIGLGAVDDLPQQLEDGVEARFGADETALTQRVHPTDGPLDGLLGDGALQQHPRQPRRGPTRSGHRPRPPASPCRTR